MDGGGCRLWVDGFQPSLWVKDNLRPGSVKELIFPNHFAQVYRARGLGRGDIIDLSLYYQYHIHRILIPLICYR